MRTGFELVAVASSTLVIFESEKLEEVVFTAVQHLCLETIGLICASQRSLVQTSIA